MLRPFGDAGVGCRFRVRSGSALASIHRSDIWRGLVSARSVVEFVGPVIGSVWARRSGCRGVICVGDALLCGVRQAPGLGVSPLVRAAPAGR